MSKTNVTFLFICENAILGLSSGIIGVILGTILIEPVLSVIINVIKEINLNSFNVNNLNMNGFNIVYLILLIFGSMMLTIISGIIPSIMASRKDPVKALLHQ
jgi:putative ABC transport system permease protein